MKVKNRTSTTPLLWAIVALVSTTTPSVADETGPRETLRRRIDFAESEILLRPVVDARATPSLQLDALVGVLHDVAGSRSFTPVLDPAEFAPAAPVSGRDGAPSEREDTRRRIFRADRSPTDTACGVVRGRTESHDLEVRRLDQTVLIRDRGRYDAAASERATDAELLAATRRLLGGLGATTAESTDFRVVALMASSRTEKVRRSATAPAGPEASRTRRLGKKVFVRRTLGGVEVAGQRAVASFQLDGRFRKLRGRWTPLDLTRSELASSLSEEAFIERAIDVILAKGVPVDSPEPIYLSTYFRTEPLVAGGVAQACGPRRVDLRGLAIVAMRGPNGAQRMVQFDFDV